jgi:hypothetical protein
MHRALALVLVAGCGTAIHTSQLNAPPTPMRARAVATVELLTAGAPSRSHVNVALLEAVEGGSFAFDATREMLGDLRAHAAAMGCDALVIGTVTPDTDLSSDPRYRKTIVGTCIIYTAEPEMIARP